MKKIILTSLCGLFLVSCGSFNVKQDQSDSAKIVGVKKVGIVIRSMKSTNLDNKDYQKNLSSWINGYKEKKSIVIIETSNNKVISYNDDTNRFYQISENNKFQEYKSLGSMKLYVKENETEFRSIIESNQLDALLIYEVQGLTFLEMQFMDIESSICMIDKDLQIVFRDHQDNRYNFDAISEFDANKILLDRASARLIERLINWGYLSK